MTEAFQDGVAGITSLVRAAGLPEEVQGTAVWCCRQLPGYYEQFRQTHESRYMDEILRLEQAVLYALAGVRQPPDPGVGAVVLDRLRLLHEQCGLPALNLTLPRAPVARARKAG